MAGKGFVGLSLDKDQGKEIQKIFKLAGIDCLTPSKFHVTVMYDESEPEIELLSNDKTYKAKITGVERLGKPGGEWEAIALLLDSPEIEKRHKELQNAGFKHKHPSFKCHMSIVYKPKDTDEDLINLIYNLGVLPEELIFGDEHLGKTV
ncbi:RNA ligase [Pectobacterium phage vB_PcaM_CBB]|uniref:Anti-CBASS protein Acb1 n=1 Tax=Pectobacterium phage vB_PcaM_CBB TaxID=2772511 RepID=A0A1L2CUH3_9CAUD|nr:RNA ligase [Pectobacterium phage vB_PcaM_CBB]AMM43683.1 structural protein [Pectobacterium phage vB_PcaM_CBB]